MRIYNSESFKRTGKTMKLWTIPNILTLLRIGLIPAFIVSFYFEIDRTQYITAGIFLLASITDYLDGFLARYLKQTSPFGEFLDPVADKLIVATALVLLVFEYPKIWMVIPGIVIISREIVISALREWMAELGKRTKVKVSMIGKIKTTVQMIAILVMLSQPVGYTHFVILGIVLLYIAVILTLWSMLIYMLAAWRTIREVD